MDVSPESPHHKFCRRYNIRGHAHYLTFSCFRRQPFLLKDRSCQWVVDAIRRARVRHNFHLWAWVLMPEHVHLLLWPQHQDYDISTILVSLKKPVTNAALRYLTRHAPQFIVHLLDRQPNGKCTRRFWQRGGGYDRNLWSAQEVWEKIHYIHMNPVRRGLVERPEQWLWSSAPDYLGLRSTSVLPLDRQSLPPQR